MGTSACLGTLAVVADERMDANGEYGVWGGVDEDEGDFVPPREPTGRGWPGTYPGMDPPLTTGAECMAGEGV